MRPEFEPPRRAITSIRVDVQEQSVEFEDAHGTIARVDFGGEHLTVDGDILDARPPALAWERPPDYIPDRVTAPVAVPLEHMEVAAVTDSAVPSPGTSFIPDLPAPTREAAPGAVPEAEQPVVLERQERLTLRGRVAAAPTFWTTRNGVPRAKFPLAVHDETDTTTYHTVQAFRRRAEQVRDKVKKGDAVEVIGYRHESTRQTKDGAAKTVPELYATVIKTR